MDKVFRIFISSVGDLLREERKIVEKSILDSNHLPIAMEHFSGPDVPPIDTVIKYLDKCDIVFLIAGHIYGQIVKNLKKANCPIKKECNNCESVCSISYTHFEFFYSYYKKKVLYCFRLKDIGNDKSFEKKLRGKDYKDECDKIRAKYASGKRNNSKLVSAIDGYNGALHPFSNTTELALELHKVSLHIKDNKRLENGGLVEAKKDENVVEASTVGTDSEPRETLFFKINHNITNSLDVYGVGMTSLSKKADNGVLERMINDGKKISLCMIEPQIFNDASYAHYPADYQIQVTKEHILSYSQNYVSYEKIIGSYNSYKELISRIKSKNIALGVIRLKTIKSFLPMSINIKDRDEENANMVVEFWIPFSERRTIMEIQKSANPTLFKDWVDYYDDLLKLADSCPDYEYIGKSEV